MLVVGSSATHQKSLTTGIIASECQNESFSRLISKLDSTEKHDSDFGKLCMKKADRLQKRGFYIFLNRRWGGLTPKSPPPPPCVSHCFNSVQSCEIDNCNGPPIENDLNNVCSHPHYRTFTFTSGRRESRKFCWGDAILN